ncbi:hypothetical protein EWM64_g7597 [Hericium alpestre]|uniref:Uncharacterized protein n=1 Tax=Hericium alpestre TaxID=135208 RepID=A0A4Y9ZP86_9AGAM|nr:hypothetical protein EWM64_g7597 [Hericium alpestre]
MTIGNTSEEPRKRMHCKAVKLSPEQRKVRKAEHLEQDQCFNEFLKGTWDQITDIIEGSAEEFDRPIVKVQELLCYDGTVIKRRKVAIHNAYTHCWAHVVDGDWDDDPAKQELIDIIHECKEVSGYNKVSAEKRAAMIKCLQKHCDHKDVSIVHRCQVQMHDVHTSCDSVSWELNNLHAWSGVQYFLYVSRSKVHQMSAPAAYLSPGEMDFVTQVLRMKANKLGHHFEAFSINSDGILSVINYISQVRKISKRNATKNLIQQALHEQLDALSSRSGMCLEYTCWEEKITKPYGIMIKGWPFDLLQSPSNFKKMDLLNELLEAIMTGKCYLRKLSDRERAEHEAEESASISEVTDDLAGLAPTTTSARTAADSPTTMTESTAATTEMTAVTMETTAATTETTAATTETTAAMTDANAATTGAITAAEVTTGTTTATEASNEPAPTQFALFTAEGYPVASMFPFESFSSTTLEPLTTTSAETMLAGTATMPISSAASSTTPPAATMTTGAASAATATMLASAASATTPPGPMPTGAASVPMLASTASATMLASAASAIMLASAASVTAPPIGPMLTGTTSVTLPGPATAASATTVSLMPSAQSHVQSSAPAQARSGANKSGAGPGPKGGLLIKFCNPGAKSKAKKSTSKQVRNDNDESMQLPKAKRANVAAASTYGSIPAPSLVDSISITPLPPAPIPLANPFMQTDMFCWQAWVWGLWYDVRACRICLPRGSELSQPTVTLSYGFFEQC